MKIAQIAPIVESVPPKKYGGTERVISDLTQELVRRGHEVTLFASGDSVTEANLVSTSPIHLRELDKTHPVLNMYGSNLYSLKHISRAYQMQHEFDIIHDHCGVLSLLAAQYSRTPVVMTIHGRLRPDSIDIYRHMARPYQVSISDSQREPAPDLHYAATVYNGLSMNSYPFSNTNDGYLLYIGRICEDKGTHLAVLAAQELDMPLIIAAKLEQNEREYFAEKIQPYLNDHIRWIGEVDEEERNKLYAHAYCFLHPVTWPEPFGLTMIESMACGTPVVAFQLGSIPEVISHGKTGFIVESYAQFIYAIRKARGLDRMFCRRYALRRFSAEAMADNYLDTYTDILSEVHHVESIRQRHFT